jgi:hypothetical protein
MRSLTTGISSSANAASALSSARQASKASSGIVSGEAIFRSRIKRGAKLRLRHSRYALRGVNSASCFAGSVQPTGAASTQKEVSTAGGVVLRDMLSHAGDRQSASTRQVLRICSPASGPVPRRGRFLGIVFERQLREEGYRGGVTILRDYVRRIRPTKRPVYLKLHFAPGW